MNMHYPMREFPIILFPPAIARIQTELPPIAKLPQPPTEPIPPKPIGPPPQWVQWKIIVGVTLAVIVMVLICEAALSSIAPGFVHGLKLFAGAAVPGVITGGLVSQILSYPKRRQKYYQAQQRFVIQQRQYDQAEAYFSERQRRYEFALETYHKRHEQLKASRLTPDKIAKMRQAKYLSALQHTSTYDGTGSITKAGSSEALLGKALALYFPNRIKTGLQLTIPKTDNWSYDPDFAYIDKKTGLHIDIEVDEPYSHKSGKPIHYQGKDDRRNEFFGSKGWVVIRFCEKQVVLSPKRCCKTVALVIAELTGDASVLQPFANIPDLEPIPQWTQKESLIMARQEYRDQYQPVKQSPGKRRSSRSFAGNRSRSNTRAKSNPHAKAKRWGRKG
jgi:hypothetical protein